MTPTQRTLKYLRDLGWEACVVERWIARAQKRIDAFGFGDILALRPQEIERVKVHGDDIDWIRPASIVMVQTTSGSNHSAHRKKILAEPLAYKWLDHHGKILLISWRKLKVKRGGKAMKWTPRIEWLTKEDFDAEPDHE